MNNTRVNTKFGVARRDERGYLQITSRKEGNNYWKRYNEYGRFFNGNCCAFRFD